MEKKRILVVDDNTDLTKLVRMNLERIGEFEVMEMNKGGEALNAARLFKPDLILLDVLMPDMDGGEVCEKIEEDPQFRDVPIIFLTGVVSEEEIIAGNGTIGQHEFLSKPIDANKLVSTIRRHLYN